MSISSHGFNKLPTWAETLLKGDVSGGTSPKLSNGDRVEALNGDSYFDPRHNNTDSIARLHGNEQLNLTTKFRGSIIIGQSTAAGAIPTFTLNQVYQTVQILNPNIRGTLSFGNIDVNTNPTLVLWGGEYQQQRWGNFYMYGGTANISNPSLGSQAPNSVFSIKSNLGLNMVTWRSGVSITGGGSALYYEMFSGSASIGSLNQPSIFRLHQSHYDNNNSVAVNRTFDIYSNRTFDGTNYNAVINIDYNDLTAIKIFNDASLETNTIQLTNGSTIKDINNNSFINMRSSNIDGRVSISDSLYVNSTNKYVGVGVTPTTHKLQILGDGTEDLLKIGVPSRDYYFNINSLGQSHFFTFGSGQGGVSIGSQSSFARLNNAVLSVYGNFSTAAVASFGNATTLNSTINSPDGWRYLAGLTAFGDSTDENRGYILPRNGTLTFYSPSFLNKGLTITSSNDSNVFLGSRDATNSITTTKSTLHFEGKYWDGSASAVKASSISFDANLDGTSNIAHSVDGTNVIVLKSNGVLNYTNYPTSPTGLVAGDIWSDGGVLTVI